MKNKPFRCIQQILIQLFKTDKKSTIVFIVCFVSMSFLPVVSTYLMVELINAITGKTSAIAIWVLLYFAAFAFSQTVEVGSNIIKNTTIYDKLKDYNQQQFTKKCASLKLISYDDVNTLNLMHIAKNCMEDDTMSQTFVKIINLTTGLISIISLTALMFSYHYLFVPIVFISIFPFLLVKLISGKKLYQLVKDQTSVTRKNNYIWDLFTHTKSLKEIKVIGFGAYLMDKWSLNQKNIHKVKLQYKTAEVSKLFVCEIIKLLGYMMSIFFAVYLFQQSAISIGVLGSCFMALKTAQNAMKYLLIDVGTLSQQVASIHDFFAFMSTKEEEISHFTSEITDFDSITIHNLSFSYPGGKKIIDNLNLQIKRGERIALIGKNGCGKTTLIKLLLNLYEPDQGQILFNHHPIQSVNNYQSIFSIVEQNFMRLSLPLRENIAISNIADINADAKIRASLQNAGLPMEDVDLDSYLGKEFGGIELSGGEWQKIAIARAIFKDGDFYVLDEPTSALDPHMENKILENFLSLLQHSTSIVVSHRIGICKIVDRIVVLDQGKIIEEGSHDQLIKTNGVYAQMFYEQSKWYE